MNRREFVASVAALAVEVKMARDASAHGNEAVGIPKWRSASPLVLGGGRLARLTTDALEVRTIGKAGVTTLPLAGPRGVGRLAKDEIVAIGQPANDPSKTMVLRLPTGQEKPAEHRGVVPLGEQWAPVFGLPTANEILVVSQYARAWRVGLLPGEIKLAGALELDPNCERTLTSHGDGSLVYFVSAQVVRKTVADGSEARFPVAGEWLEHLAPGADRDHIWGTTSSGKLALVALEKKAAKLVGAVDLRGNTIVHMHAAPTFAAVLVAKDQGHFEIVVADEKQERWRQAVTVANPFEPPYVAVSPTHVAVADAKQVTIWDAQKGSKV